MESMKRKVFVKVIALVLSVACMSTLVGCFGAKGGSGGTGGSGGLGGNNSKEPALEVSIEREFITGNYDGSKLLVIDLKIKNNSDYNEYGTGIQDNTKATLDGKTLATAYLSDKNPNAISYSAVIAPGEEGPGQLVYQLPSTEGTVDLVISVRTIDYLGTVEVLSKSIDLAKTKTIVSESEYKVVLENMVKTDDGNGKDLLVLYITFTNNSDEAKSFGSAINVELFQNDIALKMGYMSSKNSLYDNDLMFNTYTDIKKGASIKLQLTYELLDAKSPIEFSCKDMWSYDRAVILEKVIDLAKL
jgi:hypothetical protein